MNNEEVYLADAIAVIDEVLSSGGEFQMFPKGTSMLPLLVQGRDSVVLRRHDECPAKKHDIAFYRRANGQFVLHRVMKVCRDGSYVMCGDNQFVLEPSILPEQIIGYVSLIYRGKKPWRLDSLRYRIYVFFWTCMPYRRLIRFPKRAISYLKRHVFGKK